MASSHIASTFSTGSNSAAGNVSDSCVIPTGVTTMRLTVDGLDGSNTVKTQRRTSPGGAWTDQTTYSSNQTNVGVTVATGQEWRLQQIAQQPIRDIRYSLTAL